MMLASMARKESDKVCYAEGMRHSRTLVPALYDNILKAINVGSYQANVQLPKFPHYKMSQIVIRELKKEFKTQGFWVKVLGQYDAFQVSW